MTPPTERPHRRLGVTLLLVAIVLVAGCAGTTGSDPQDESTTDAPTATTETTAAPATTGQPGTAEPTAGSTTSESNTVIEPGRPREECKLFHTVFNTSVGSLAGTSIPTYDYSNLSHEASVVVDELRASPNGTFNTKNLSLAAPEFFSYSDEIRTYNVTVGNETIPINTGGTMGCNQYIHNQSE